MWILAGLYGIINLGALIFFFWLTYLNSNPFSIFIYPALDELFEMHCNFTTKQKKIIKIVGTIIFLPAVIIYFVLNIIAVLLFIIIIAIITLIKYIYELIIKEK